MCNVSCPVPSSEVPLLTNWNPGVSHRSVHFTDIGRADRSTTLDYKTDIVNSSGTATNNFSTAVGSTEDEKPKYHTNDSYINPNGMTTSQGVICMSPFHYPTALTNETWFSGGEKFKVRRKPCIKLADVDEDEIPKCSTPDGEETEVQIMSVGHSPRPISQSQSRSHSRGHSWSLPPQGFDPTTDTRADTPEEPAAGGVVSKVMAMFYSNNNGDDGAAAPSSMIVSVKTLTENRIDPVQDPRFDPDQRRWRNPQRASAVGQEGDLETGL